MWRCRQRLVGQCGPAPLARCAEQPQRTFRSAHPAARGLPGRRSGQGVPPAHRLHQGPGMEPQLRAGAGGYGYNMMYLGSRLWEASADAGSAPRRYTHTTAVTEVKNPGQTLMFADAAIAKNGCELIEYSFAEPPFAVSGGQVMTDFGCRPRSIFGTPIVPTSAGPTATPGPSPWPLSTSPTSTASTPSRPASGLVRARGQYSVRSAIGK